MENQLASQFETLLPLVSSWAREQEQIALSHGVPLSEPELFEARRVGVREPDKVRLLKVESIPIPSHPLLQAAIRATNLVPAAPRGLTLNYAIFVRSDCWGNRPLIVHELVHIAQYERLGGIEQFLRAYLTQCVAVGYKNSAMETEARGTTGRIYPGIESAKA